MQNNKSPGSDGITIEFYKIFWNEIKSYLINSLNYSFNNGNLTVLQKQGIISLIPKPGKNLETLSNWRPISLLNTDYKIATKSISNRIKKILPSTISSSQSGFIKGRYIGENVRLIQECINFFNNTNKSGLIFFADFEKAFDSLDHSFMFTCLEKMNFGENMIKWVKLFYTDINSLIINNGFFSDSFNIGRGVRQGCPLSSSLFIICLEFLSHYIQSNPDINGISIKPGEEIKQSLFADDATYFCNNNPSSFNNLIKSLTLFGNVSGLKLNKSKCTVLKVGNYRHTNIHLKTEINFHWTSKEASTLGITFTNTENETVLKNIIPRL